MFKAFSGTCSQLCPRVQHVADRCTKHPVLKGTSLLRQGGNVMLIHRERMSCWTRHTKSWTTETGWGNLCCVFLFKEDDLSLSCLNPEYLFTIAVTDNILTPIFSPFTLKSKPGLHILLLNYSDVAIQFLVPAMNGSTLCPLFTDDSVHSTNLSPHPLHSACKSRATESLDCWQLKKKEGDQEAMGHIQ